MKVKLMVFGVCILMCGTLAIADLEHKGATCSTATDPGAGACSNCEADYWINANCDNAYPEHRLCIVRTCNATQARYKTCLDSNQGSDNCLMDVTFPPLTTCTGCKFHSCGCASSQGICDFAACSCNDVVIYAPDFEWSVSNTCT